MPQDVSAVGLAWMICPRKQFYTNLFFNSMFITQ
jgi:hypothetical protein